MSHPADVPADVMGPSTTTTTTITGGRTLKMRLGVLQTPSSLSSYSYVSLDMMELSEIVHVRPSATNRQ